MAITESPKVQFRAKREATCGACTRPIAVGEPITWDRSTRPTVYHHLACWHPETAPRAIQLDATSEDSRPALQVAPDPADALAVLAQAVAERMPRQAGVSKADIDTAVARAVLALETRLKRSLASALAEAGERFQEILESEGIS